MLGASNNDITRCPEFERRHRDSIPQSTDRFGSGQQRVDLGDVPIPFFSEPQHPVIFERALRFRLRVPHPPTISSSGRGIAFTDIEDVHA
jgi:hypothetical protein